MISIRRSIRFVATIAVLALVSCGGATVQPPAGTGATFPDDVSTSTTITTTTTTTTASPTTTTPSTTTREAEPLTEAVALFGDWVAALAEGETERAWDLMAPSSQLAFGSYERFFEMRTGFAEGWGSWVAVEDPSYSLEEDEAGRTLLIAGGTIHPEGNTEHREVGVPLVEEDGALLLSPFEEFGNVAEGLEEEASGVDHPAVPEDSGDGRRIVYSNSGQRVWLVEADGTVADTYLVSGKQGVPAPGSYEVFSKSEVAFAGHDDITMSHMVRFAHGQTLDIGFHAIPNDGNGRPIQTEEELGDYRSAGCVRQSPGHAAALFEWADSGTPVVVLP
ncbi:MAG: L,D-transpeptidase [Acidimicrobiia bacterium]